MKPLSERIKNFPANQFIDWLCLSCVDVREVSSEEDAQYEINKIRQAVTERLTGLEQQRDALAAESAALKSAISEHSEGFTVCPCCGTEHDSSHDDVCRAINETPATDAHLNSVRAEAIPEGYVLVPKEMCLSANAMEAICFYCGDGDHMFGEFTDGILWVGEIDHGDGNKTYGLNVATADYPDEGSGVVCEFINPSSEAGAVKDGE